MRYAEVVILKSTVKWGASLTYIIPNDLPVAVGSLVTVPFGKQQLMGVVIDLKDRLPSSLEASQMKSILKWHSELSIPKLSVQLAKWMSDYYRSSIKKTIRLFLPKKWQKNELSPPVVKSYKLIKPDFVARGEKQKEIILFLKEQAQSLSREAIDLKFGKSMGSILKNLIKKEVIKEEEIPLFKHYEINSSGIKKPLKKLTNEQIDALEKIKSTSLPVLLHGVTGSGKTEIYLRQIIETIQLGKQVLLLLPEIALTPQMINYFKDYFGDHIALFHSKLTDLQRNEEWWKVKTKYAPLVIGSRSAIFAPIDQYGLIILDEEHEWTYKQESSPHYETHQLALKIQKETGAKLIFGSATPKAESYHQSKIGNYLYVALKNRIHMNPLPTIKVIDLREEFKKKNFSIFSLSLQNKIKQRLENNEQIILFVNQRGLANAVVCRDCGYKEECPHCEISLKLHKHSQTQQIAGELICHYCHFKKNPPLSCPHCQSVYIKNIGIGTQRVEKEIKQLFPEAKVVRADSDSIKQKSFSDIYHEFLDQKYNILVGTQMIAKGLDFSNVSLIGIILADVGLHIPDFRSSERLFQILTQVAGRCGRGDQLGEVVLQTYQPTHETIKKISTDDYLDFIEEELTSRRRFNYPPFHRLIKFIVVGQDEKALAEHIKVEQEILEDIFSFNQLAFKITSAPSLIPKIANRFYYQVLIRAENPHLIFNHWKPPKGWRVDVDPVHTV